MPALSFFAVKKQNIFKDVNWIAVPSQLITNFGKVEAPKGSVTVIESWLPFLSPMTEYYLAVIVSLARSSVYVFKPTESLDTIRNHA